MTAFYMFRLVFMTFLRRIARRSRSRAPHPRIAALDDRAAGDSRGALVRRRMDWLAGNSGRQQPLHAFSRAGDRRSSCHAGGSGAGRRVPGGRDRLDAAVGGLVVSAFWLPGTSTSSARSCAERYAKRFRRFYRLVYHKYYVDQIYDAMFVNRAKDLGLALGAFDRDVIDGLGRERRRLADALRRPAFRSGGTRGSSMARCALARASCGC